MIIVGKHYGREPRDNDDKHQLHGLMGSFLCSALMWFIKVSAGQAGSGLISDRWDWDITGCAEAKSIWAYKQKAGGGRLGGYQGALERGEGHGGGDAYVPAETEASLCGPGGEKERESRESRGGLKLQFPF